MIITPTALSEKAIRKVEARKTKVVVVQIIPVFPGLVLAWLASFMEDWFLYGGFVVPVQWRRWGTHEVKFLALSFA